MAREMHSPTAPAARLEYLTVESYAWPKQVRPERSRMEVDERRRRHREDQRRFMIRKHERVAALRKEATLGTMRLQLLWALNEEKALHEERRQIELLPIDHATHADTEVYSSCISFVATEVSCSPLFRPFVATETMPPGLDPMLSDVLLSL